MLVFLHHAAYSFEAALEKHPLIHSFWFQRVIPIVDFGVFGVFLFFLISGIVIPASIRRGKTTAGHFLIKRFYRIYPLYLGSLGLAFAIYSTPITAIMANLTFFPKLLGHTEALGVYWSLQVEVIYYFLVAALIATGWLHSRLTSWLFFILTGALTMTLASLRQCIPNLPVSPAISLFCISAGYLLYQSSLAKSRPPPLTSRVTMASIAGLVVIGGYISRNPKYMDKFAYASSIMLAFLLIYTYPIFRQVVPRAIRHGIGFIGTISFSVYLIHQPLLHYFQSHNWFNLPVYLSIPTALLLTLAASYTTYSVLEKPFLRNKRCA